MESELAPGLPGGQLLIYQDGALRVQVRIDGRTVWSHTVGDCRVVPEPLRRT
jgi:hypothetical protein